MNTNPLQHVLVKIFQMKGATTMKRNTLSHVIAKGLRLLFAAALMAGLALAIPTLAAESDSSCQGVVISTLSRHGFTPADLARRVPGTTAADVNRAVA